MSATECERQSVSAVVLSGCGNNYRETASYCVRSGHYCLSTPQPMRGTVSAKAAVHVAAGDGFSVVVAEDGTAYT